MLVTMVRTVSLTVDLAVCQKLVRSQNLSLPFPFIFTFENNIKIHVFMQ